MKIVSIMVPAFKEENCFDASIERLGIVFAKRAYQAEILEMLK
jgi:hypothetical protein